LDERGRGGCPSLVLRKVAVAAALGALLVAAVGCGQEEGVADGATVTAYVSLPLCGDAKRELAQEGGRAGELEVRLFCLARTGGAEDLSLAAVGANARLATEDSTTVAYVEDPGPANRFARPIVEEAGIAWTTSNSGSTAMKKVLEAVSEADSGSLRDSVREALG
jgi:hypothetical protein